MVLSTILSLFSVSHFLSHLHENLVLVIGNFLTMQHFRPLGYLKCSSRSSRPEVFCEKGVLTKFTKFTGKHLCLRPATLLKKSLWYKCFPVNFAKFIRTPFFIEQLRWLLLFGGCFCSSSRFNTKLHGLPHAAN